MKKPHLAFGGGPHFCIGNQLARLEGQVSILRMVQQFPNMRLAVRLPERVHNFALRVFNPFPFYGSLQFGLHVHSNEAWNAYVNEGRSRNRMEGPRRCNGWSRRCWSEKVGRQSQRRFVIGWFLGAIWVQTIVNKAESRVSVKDQNCAGNVRPGGTGPTAPLPIARQPHPPIGAELKFPRREESYPGIR